MERNFQTRLPPIQTIGAGGIPAQRSQVFSLPANVSSATAKRQGGQQGVLRQRTISPKQKSSSTSYTKKQPVKAHAGAKQPGEAVNMQRGSQIPSFASTHGVKSSLNSSLQLGGGSLSSAQAARQPRRVGQVLPVGSSLGTTNTGPTMRDVVRNNRGRLKGGSTVRPPQHNSQTSAGLRLSEVVGQPAIRQVPGQDPVSHNPRWPSNTNTMPQQSLQRLQTLPSLNLVTQPSMQTQASQHSQLVSQSLQQSFKYKPGTTTTKTKIQSPPSQPAPPQIVSQPQNQTQGQVHAPAQNWQQLRISHQSQQSVAQVRPRGFSDNILRSQAAPTEPRTFRIEDTQVALTNHQPRQAEKSFERSNEEVLEVLSSPEEENKVEEEVLKSGSPDLMQKVQEIGCGPQKTDERLRTSSSLSLSPEVIPFVAPVVSEPIVEEEQIDTTVGAQTASAHGRTSLEKQILDRIKLSCEVRRQKPSVDAQRRADELINQIIKESKSKKPRSKRKASHADTEQTAEEEQKEAEVAAVLDEEAPRLQDKSDLGVKQNTSDKEEETKEEEVQLVESSFAVDDCSVQGEPVDVPTFSSKKSPTKDMSCGPSDYASTDQVPIHEEEKKEERSPSGSIAASASGSDDTDPDSKSRAANGSRGAGTKIVKPSLLTSTGSGPDGAKNQVAVKKDSTKPATSSSALSAPVPTPLPDKTSHISKFANSLIFNALERVTKAGSELQPRGDDPTNPVQQLNRGKILYDFDSEEGQALCKKYLEAIENLFALTFLKRANRDYRDSFSAAYRVLYDASEASPLNYLVEILDSAQESFPYLWVNGKKYEFSQLVLQQGNMLYSTFNELKSAIHTLHLHIVTARATMTDVFCSLTPIELQKMRTKVEHLLEAFDQDWTIFEKSYVTELMEIESDARRFVVDAIGVCQQMLDFESEQRRRGKVFFTGSEAYNILRNKFLKQISQINCVANHFGQGRDDLDISVLIVADDVGRKVSANQSFAVRKLCDQIQKSFSTLRDLFLNRYQENVEVVDPQLRNNPELVEALEAFEKDWCLGKTHLVPKQNRDQLLSFSQLIEGTSEKYPDFAALVECRDAEIFLTIPYLLVLKSSLDVGNEALLATQVCSRFFPKLFDKEGEAAAKFEQLKKDFDQMRQTAGPKSFFHFYSQIEEQILLGEKQTPVQPVKEKAADLEDNSTNWKLLQSQVQAIKEIGVNLTRHSPQEWNEFMIVALG